MKMVMMMIGGISIFAFALYYAVLLTDNSKKADKQFSSLIKRGNSVYDEKKDITQNVKVAVGNNGKDARKNVKVVEVSANDNNKSIIQKTIKTVPASQNKNTTGQPSNIVTVNVIANNQESKKHKDKFDESWDKMDSDFNKMEADF